ncbi:MAG: energy transducer TonB family protein, partial [Candidatus Krumholzibacteriia bacterium]
FNPCFVLARMARPEYPAGVSEAERRRARITVEAAFYVGLEGNVSASYILKSEGGPAFDRAVLQAVNSWKFTPVHDPACPPLGFWIRLPIVFHSPYKGPRPLALPGRPSPPPLR